MPGLPVRKSLQANGRAKIPVPGLGLVKDMLHSRFLRQAACKVHLSRRIDEQGRLPYKPRQIARQSVLLRRGPRMRLLLIGHLLLQQRTSVAQACSGEIPRETYLSAEQIGA
jgi:hypothetical protein